MLRPQRILVIGYGFIGSAIVRGAVRRGIGVRVLTRSEPAAFPDEFRGQVELMIGDAAASSNVAAAVAEVDHVIFAAGDLRSGISAPDPAAALLSEVRPLLQTLEACRQQPALSFTYLSSGGTVYGIAAGLPIPEHHPTEPVVSYGVAKLACEKYVWLYSRLYGLRARVARCANAYGEGQPVDRPQGIIGVCLNRIAKGLPITIYGDGSVVRDYVHVDDVASAILGLCQAPEEPRVVNVGSGVGTSIRELTHLMREITQRAIDVRWEAPRGFDVQANVLDITKLKALIDFEPKALEVGMSRTWDQISRCASGPQAADA